MRSAVGSCSMLKQGSPRKTPGLDNNSPDQNQHSGEVNSQMEKEKVQMETQRKWQKVRGVRSLALASLTYV